MQKLKNLTHHRFGPVSVVVLAVVCISFITRLVLFFMSWSSLELDIFKISGIFLIGFFYDLVVASFFSIPILFYCWLMKDSWYQKQWNRIPLFFLMMLIVFILIVNAGAEITFWDEFNVRYNFIAVDYLIYTNEVLGNISESYNLGLISVVVLVTVVLLLFSLRNQIIASQKVSLRFASRSKWFLLLLIFPTCGYLLVDNSFKNISDNNFVNELAGDGIYEFGSAFWHNEIEYTKFYKVNENAKNIEFLRSQFSDSGIVFSNKGLDIERKVSAGKPELKCNIVLISVESFSADYLKYFGNQENLSPNLDSLIPHSLFFENCYASGTRTVRGLEALSLAIPPTPGQSIVRRPNNEHMFTMGHVLKSKGFDVKYIYGGNSFFDNMGYFFSNSDYKVIDKSDIPASRIHHETAWGIADEDAFGIVLDECDKSHKNGHLFFNHIMTVSNHRPFTYPDGRIDIPSASQVREGAVKYTDYAIGKFLRDAHQKPWFDNTIFVIVADHCAKSAGKTDLPVNRYHIPCFVYAPALVKPGVVSRMVSQIDLAPTVLGMMNLEYTSKFMGFDIFRTNPDQDRVFISTYQDMGYLKHDTLVILSPKKKTATFLFDKISGVNKPIAENSKLTAEAVAWYQGASFLYTSNAYKSQTSHR